MHSARGAAGAAIVLFLCPALYAAGAWSVKDFGAKGDGITKDTAAIQKTIDAAAEKGGGTVIVPPGRYLSGSIHLRSNITLHLDNGSVLLASTDNGDFDAYETLPFQSVSDDETTYFRYSLVAAENVRHIAIVGQGIIDGNRTRRRGPKTVAIKLCQYITIRGITIRNSPNYSISFWGSDYVDIDGVTILNGFADGIDPDSSRYVRISNSYIDCYDDAICPKASPSMGIENRRPTENLTVTNCVLRTNCSNFKFGTESSGDFRNIAVSNCTMLRREKGRAPISGISLESVDGSNIDGVAISNIVMEGVTTPVFIRLGNRGRGMTAPTPGSVQNVSIRNILARNSTMTSSVTGIPGARVKRVSLDGIRIAMEGGNSVPGGLDVPEHAEKYPEGTMFGALPAYGFYARHADGLTLTNFHVGWDKRDLRPAMILDDVKGVSIDGFETDTVSGSSPVVWFHNVADALLRGARVAAAEIFLRVSGRDSAGITVMGSDLSRVRQAVEIKDAPKSAAREMGNALSSGSK